ncbi:hypothetical protein [Staphylococcus phage PMBT8]|nr:hypothetical protein [Staphylococcus phage PMBT8]
MDVLNRNPPKRQEGSAKKWKDVETYGFKVLDKYKDYKVYGSPNIEVACNSCNQISFRSSEYLYRNGFLCPKCNDNTMSYPERLFKSLLIYLNIEHEQEYIDKRLPNRRFDFKIGNTYYEINGEQHYVDKQSNFSSLSKVSRSDKEKIDFCDKNNIKLVFINASNTSYKRLMKNYKEALNIQKDIDKEEIFKIMSNINKDKYKSDMLIINDYKEGMKIKEIINKHEIGRKALSNLLNRYDIKRERVKRRVPVICLNNLREYDSVLEASKDIGFKNSGSVNGAINRNRGSAGKDSEGNKIYWISKEEFKKIVDSNENR